MVFLSLTCHKLGEAGEAAGHLKLYAKVLADLEALATQLETDKALTIPVKLLLDLERRRALLKEAETSLGATSGEK